MFKKESETIEVLVKPLFFTCYNGIFPNKIFPRGVSAVIVPIKILVKKDEKENVILYSWSCNYETTCENSLCLYSSNSKSKREH